MRPSPYPHAERGLRQGGTATASCQAHRQRERCRRKRRLPTPSPDLSKRRGPLDGARTLREQAPENQPVARAALRERGGVCAAWHRCRDRSRAGVVNGVYIATCKGFVPAGAHAKWIRSSAWASWRWRHGRDTRSSSDPGCTVPTTGGAAHGDTTGPTAGGTGATRPADQAIPNNRRSGRRAVADPPEFLGGHPAQLRPWV